MTFTSSLSRSSPKAHRRTLSQTFRVVSRLVFICCMYTHLKDVESSSLRQFLLLRRPPPHVLKHDEQLLSRPSRPATCIYPGILSLIQAWAPRHSTVTGAPPGGHGLQANMARTSQISVVFTTTLPRIASQSRCCEESDMADLGMKALKAPLRL